MLKICESCRYHSDRDEETRCPTCGADLRLVLPSGVSTPGRWGESQAGGGYEGVWDRVIGSPVGLLVAFVLISLGAWIVGDWVMKDSGPGKGSETAGRIRIGMHISEVGRILDNGPPQTPSYPRTRDFYPPDEFGSGTIDYEGDGVILKIYFEGGRVTSVEESPSSLGPGFHRSTLMVHER
jgi:hypothetical protein